MSLPREWNFQVSLAFVVYFHSFFGESVEPFFDQSDANDVGHVENFPTWRPYIMLTHSFLYRESYASSVLFVVSILKYASAFMYKFCVHTMKNSIKEEEEKIFHVKIFFSCVNDLISHIN